MKFSCKIDIHSSANLQTFRQPPMRINKKQLVPSLRHTRLIQPRLRIRRANRVMQMRRFALSITRRTHRTNRLPRPHPPQRLCINAVQMRVVMKPPLAAQHQHDIATHTIHTGMHHQTLRRCHHVCAFFGENINALVCARTPPRVIPKRFRVPILRGCAADRNPVCFWQQGNRCHQPQQTDTQNTLQRFDRVNVQPADDGHGNSKDEIGIFALLAAFASTCHECTNDFTG